VVDGLIAPLLVVQLFTSSRKVMGNFVNERATMVVGWVAVGVLVAADAAMLSSVVKKWAARLA
jgi:Mn2+/Fe2+ NRAMP family transporter